jgi:hypothetical protein
VDESLDADVDIMDVPDLFSGLYDDQEAPRMPQERRSPRQVSPHRPRTKDASVRLPGGIMADVEGIADARGDTITSGSEGYSGDGVHATNSQHYQGTAIDVRYTGNRAQQIADYRRTGLVVIPEKDHLHIQAYPVSA